MKKGFEVSIPSTIIFEDIEDAVGFAKLLSNAMTSTNESVYSSDARDGRSHYIPYLKPISLNINFQMRSYLENKGEAIEKLALFKASPEELEKRDAMDKETKEAYMKELVETTKKIEDISPDSPEYF